MTRTQAQVDGYVECSWCGHPVEQHDTTGCIAVDGCSCYIRLTKTQIGTIRHNAGLPRRWAAGQLWG